MIPHFTCTQDDGAVYVDIQARHLRQADLQFLFGEREFRFLAPPYALTLHLTEAIVEDGTERAAYDPVEGRLRVRLPKAVRGQVFAGLDAPSLLVKGAPAQPPAPSGVGYGFNGRHSGVFVGLHLCEEEVLELPDPEETLPAERTQLRLLAENVKFDPLYYQGDLVESGEWAHVLQFIPWWVHYKAARDASAAQGGGMAVPPVTLSEQDHMVLVRLQPREHLLDDRAAVLCGLVDVLFAYCYHHCTMLGQESCEASWTVSRLSRLLSWLDGAEANVHAALVQSYRRALAYPLWRSWALCEHVHRVLALLLGAGKPAVVKCLLDVYHIMTHNSERRYLLNTVWVADYLVWVQLEPDVTLSQLALQVAQVRVAKAETLWPLEALERETQ